MSKVEIVCNVQGGTLYPDIMNADDIAKFEGKQILITAVTDNQEKIRTAQQNKSLQVWCRNIAGLFVAHGIDVRAIVDAMRIPTIEPDTDIIRDLVWRKMQIAMTGKKSTTSITTVECQEIYENCNKFTTRFGIHVPWPSYENQSNHQIEG
jgi:hypothetical protein